MSKELEAAIATEVARAEELLRSLEGESVETLTVKSLASEDAPFLGLIVSKLSPMIGNLLERRITQLLAQKDAKHGLDWIRQDPDFPDALLVDGKGNSTGAGYEVKAWYALSTELTGRFRESVNLLQPRNVRVCIIAWAMSHIVYGTPQVLGVMTVPAVDVALCRDAHYFKPPRYLTVEPQDTTLRTRNLQQTNVSGYRLQESDKNRISKATRFVEQHADRGAAPHSPEAQALMKELMNTYNYRLDTNFAKVDRIDQGDIEEFKTKILGGEFRGRPLKAWIQLLKQLNDDGNPTAQTKAAEVIQAIYDEL